MHNMMWSLSLEQDKEMRQRGSTRLNFQPTKISKKLRRARKNFGGFTLIELLVVIAIIGVLASVVISAVNTARQKGQDAKARSELKSIRSAIALLEDDTGKWPGGCPPGVVANPEVDLATDQAGMTQAPTVQDNGSGCEWQSSDITRWKGPYIKTPLDPWGRSYHFDSDYQQYENCASTAASDKYPAVPKFVAVVSPGPTKTSATGINDYDCDDIFLKID